LGKTRKKRESGGLQKLEKKSSGEKGGGWVENLGEKEQEGEGHY